MEVMQDDGEQRADDEGAFAAASGIWIWVINLAENENVERLICFGGFITWGRIRDIFNHTMYISM